jgi:nitrite reductase (NO-forming)
MLIKNLLLLLLLLLHRPAPASKPPVSTAVPSAGHPNAPLPATPPTAALRHNPAGLPVISAPKSKVPAVPPPCNRDYAVHAVLDLETTTVTMPVSPLHKYTWWTFDGSVPGPLVRCRVGDTLEVRYTNK